MLFETYKDTFNFRKEAIKFEKNGFYTKAPKGTIAYKEYWQEQREYCLNGYTANGVKITGRHYFYLNFCPIILLKPNNSKKTEGLPLFYDYDKFYFDMIDKALYYKKGICLLKGRRKGFSFKSASLLAYEYTFVLNSISFVGAYLEEYSKTTFNYAVHMLDFLLKHTAFGKKRIINKEDYKKAGYRLKNGAIGGTGNEIRYLTFKDNPSKGIGKSANLFIFEEVGKWHNIFESYMLTEPLLKEGNTFIGLPILQGTAGDLSEGVTPFAEFFFNPEKYNFIAIDNIFDEGNSNKKIGLFFPSSYGHSGIYGTQPYNTKQELFGTPMMDEDGNSNITVAEQDIIDKRNMLGTSGNEKAKYLYTTEYPLKPSEAFMVAGLGVFNNERLNAQITKVRSYKEYEPQRGRLEWKIDNGIINYNEVVWIPDPQGAIKIWEHPEPNITNESPYLSGIDPIDINITRRKAYHSDGAMLVIKTVHIPKHIDNNIKEWHKNKDQRLYNALVCEYVDRPNDAEVFFENTLKINTYYKCFNRQCLVENNKKNIIDYYNRMKKTLLYLHGSPEILEGKIDYNPSVKVGVTLTESVKNVAIQYLIQFLEKYTEHIFSEDLLEELVIYNEIGNFDRVSALLMAIMMFEEKEFTIKRKIVKKEYVSLPMYTWQNGKLIAI